MNKYTSEFTFRSFIHLQHVFLTFQVVFKKYIVIQNNLLTGDDLVSQKHMLKKNKLPKSKFIFCLIHFNMYIHVCLCVCVVECMCLGNSICK